MRYNKNYLYTSSKLELYRVSQKKVHKFEINNLCSDSRSISKIGVVY